MRLRTRITGEHARTHSTDAGERPAAVRLAAPGAPPAELDFTIGELGALRSLVSEATARTSLEAERASDLVLAVNELATNSICHGGGQGTLLVWREECTLLCEVRDSGHISDADMRLGAEPPGPEAMSGRGLWLVDQLCDAVQISSSLQGGSSVRVQMNLR